MIEKIEQNIHIVYNDPDHPRTYSKAHLQQLKAIFENFTNDKTHDWKKLAEQGIYPLRVGTGENQQLRGFRLGKPNDPQEKQKAKSNSVCFQAMVHNNEPGGLGGIDEVLTWWKEKLNNNQREAISGDIYLMFAGEKQQAEVFFNTLLPEGKDTEVTTVTVDEVTHLRSTVDRDETFGWHGTNRNRLPKGTFGMEQRSQKDLQDDYTWLEEHVYKTCAADPGQPTGFILGFHTGVFKEVCQ